MLRLWDLSGNARALHRGKQGNQIINIFVTERSAGCRVHIELGERKGKFEAGRLVGRLL